MHLDFYSKTSRQSKILFELVFNQKRHSCYRKQKKNYTKKYSKREKELEENEKNLWLYYFECIYVRDDCMLVGIKIN